MEIPIYSGVMDPLGRVVLPIEIRRKMGWLEKTDVCFFPGQEDGEIIIRENPAAAPAHNICLFCGETRGLIEYRKKLVCESCMKKLAGLA